MVKKKTKNPLEEYLKKYDWLWENNTPMTTVKKSQKTR